MSWTRKLPLVLCLIAVAGCSQPEPPPITGTPPDRVVTNVPEGPFPSSFSLTLRREGGELMRQCKLIVHVNEDQGRGEVVCFVPDAPFASASEALPQSEVKELRTLSERSRLYDGGHTGVTGSYTIPLDTLTFQGERGHTVVLVTPGNKSFQEHPPRKELLALLWRIEGRLAPQALRTYSQSRTPDRRPPE